MSVAPERKRRVEPAQYRCLTCSYEWHKTPDSGNPSNVTLPTCPKCGALYLEWIDFEGWRERNPLE